MKIVVLAALALALGTAHQAAACDLGVHAANATIIVVANAEVLTIKPETAAPKGTTTDEPQAPPVIVAAGSCSGC